MLLTLTCSDKLLSQSDEWRNSFIEQRIEEIAAGLDDGQQLDYTTLFDDLAFYFEHPMNVNTATTEDLESLYLLTDVQIAAIRQHIQRFGDLRNLYELQAIQGLDLPTIRALILFVTVNPVMRWSDVSLSALAQEGTHDLFLRYRRTLENQQGFLPDPETGQTPYIGSPDYLYTRYRYQFRKSLRAGFTFEKDAGETMRHGPDFASAHIMYTGQSWLKKWVIGDYQVLFGQGLTLWNGLAFGKSSFVSNVKRNGVGLRAYSSVQEFNYLRGSGITVGRGNWEATAFGSMKKIDASTDLNTDSTTITDDGLVITSMPLGGTHRTESEIAAKDQVTETCWGGNVKWSKGAWSLGLTGVQTKLNIPVQPDGSLYNLFKLSSQTTSNLGMDYQGVIRNANFFGEFARSQNGGFAAINGLVVALHPQLTFSVVNRLYSKNYQSRKTNAFGDNNLTGANEHGTYIGMQASLNGKFTLSAYADIIRYPWLRYRVDAPSFSTDYLAQLNFKPDKKNEFYLRVRHRNNALNTSIADTPLSYPVSTEQLNVRLNGTYNVHPNIQMKSRAEWSHFMKENTSSRGFMIYQDIIYKKLGSKVSWSFRYALFDTQGWESRIYAFENDVLYAFSILPYYGRGSRVYAMAKWDITRGLDCWIRYGYFLYDDRNIISSGNSQITGNQKSDVHLQLRLQF
ncbi:MAG: ComEA family DNA-binding protein [Flavobacteriales bacterium]